MAMNNVRLLSTGSITHQAQSGGCTACGVLYCEQTREQMISFMVGVPVDEPVDCMTCLVQETRDAADKLTFHVTLQVPVPVTTYTFVLEPDSE